MMSKGIEIETVDEIDGKGEKCHWPSSRFKSAGEGIRSEGEKE
jgi:hypothetical protein